MDKIKCQCHFAGVHFVGLRQIAAKGGPVLHMLRNDSPTLKKFGEVYFSEVFSGALKAWKRHREMTQHFVVPVGKVLLVMFDEREGSKTFGEVRECILGRPDHYNLLVIPPMVWYGFKCISENPALISNCTDMPHNPEESEHALPGDSRFPYDWKELKE